MLDVVDFQDEVAAEEEVLATMPNHSSNQATLQTTIPSEVRQPGVVLLNSPTKVAQMRHTPTLLINLHEALPCLTLSQAHQT